MSDAGTTVATAAWINTVEYKELNFARKALVINPTKAWKLPTVLVSHDAAEAAALADTIILCSVGRVIRQGTPGEVPAFQSG